MHNIWHGRCQIVLSTGNVVKICVLIRKHFFLKEVPPWIIFVFNDVLFWIIVKWSSSTLLWKNNFLSMEIQISHAPKIPNIFIWKCWWTTCVTIIYFPMLSCWIGPPKNNTRSPFSNTLYLKLGHWWMITPHSFLWNIIHDIIHPCPNALLL